MKAFQTLIASAALAVSASASATLVLPGSEQPLQNIINSLYRSAACPTCSPVSAAPDVNANQAGEVGLFQIEASGGSVATMIIEVAGNSGSNTFGIYDPYNSSTYLQLFGGAATGGNQAFLSVTDSFSFSVNSGAGVQFTSSTFGYYLGGANGPMFYSQPILNGDEDHMVAFQGDGDSIKLPTKPKGVWGSSSYILAWEDLPFSESDKDYNDMVVYVESVTPVPEPGSIALLGLGLAGVAAVARRQQKKA